jgi:hypothetical protein
MEDSHIDGTIKSMNCYLCIAQGIYGIVLSPEEVYACDSHYDELMERFIRSKRRGLCDPHQAESWTHRDKKSGSLRKHKLSKGKAWEIGNRTLASDGKTVINRITGKLSEY